MLRREGDRIADTADKVIQAEATSRGHSQVDLAVYRYNGSEHALIIDGLWGPLLEGVFSSQRFLSL